MGESRTVHVGLLFQGGGGWFAPLVTALCIWNIYHIYDSLPLLWFCAHLTILQLNLTSTGIPPLGKEQRTTLQLLVTTFELGLTHQYFWVMLVGLHPKRLVSYAGPGPVKSGTLRHGSRQGLLPRNWVSWTKLHSTMTLFAACPFKLNYICPFKLNWISLQVKLNMSLQVKLHVFGINQLISSLNLNSHTPEMIWIHVFINLPSYQRAGHGSFGLVRLGKSQIDLGHLNLSIWKWSGWIQKPVFIEGLLCAGHWFSGSGGTCMSNPLTAI